MSFGDEKNARIEPLLRHAGLYRVTTRAAIRAAFPKLTVAVIGRLILECLNHRPALLRVAGKLPAGQKSIYQLTHRGAALLGLPRDRAEDFEPQALYAHLAALAYCFHGPRSRFRLEAAEVERVFGGGGEGVSISRNRIHCLEPPGKPGDPAKLCETYAPGPDTEPKSINRKVLTWVEAVGAHSTLALAVETRQYGLAVLVESPERRDQLRRIIGAALLEMYPHTDAKKPTVYVEAVKHEPRPHP